MARTRDKQRSHEKNEQGAGDCGNHQGPVLEEDFLKEPPDDLLWSPSALKQHTQF